MKDDRGLYYFPNPNNKQVRVYVKKIDGNICFRLWKQDDPCLWDDHGWAPYEAIKEASQLYEGRNFDPGMTYDIVLARYLITEESKNTVTGI